MDDPSGWNQGRLGSLIAAIALLILAGCGDGGGSTPASPAPSPAPVTPMSVSGTVRSGGDPAAAVEGAVVRATNLGTGQMDGEARTDSGGAYRIEGLRGDRYAIEVTPPSGFLSVAPAIISRPATGELEFSVDFSLIPHLPPAPAVTALPAGELIRRAANYFDLEGKTVAFTPEPGTAGTYSVGVASLSWENPGLGAAGGVSRTVGDGQAVDLPFPFPFAGRTWNRLYANRTGSVTFQQAEGTHRDPWKAASVTGAASAIDARSTVGLETMIAALWLDYDHATISLDSAPSRVMVTWRARRRVSVNEHGHGPLGDNLFQARLYPSGVIELAFRAVAEQDGIVGLFHGVNPTGRTLDLVADPSGDVTLEVLDIRAIEWVDNGTTLIARMTLAADVPERVDVGDIEYRIFLDFGDYDCAIGLEVSASGRRAFSWCDPGPSTIIARVHGATIEIPVSRTFLLSHADRFAWDADAVWWGRDKYDQLSERSDVDVRELDFDLSTLRGAVAGNTFEVFHYPVMLTGIRPVLTYVHQRAPADAEIAVTFTDFRFDDFIVSSYGSGPINTTARGIGESLADPSPGDEFGSEKLLTSMRVAFIGAPAFGYANASQGYALRNYAPGIGWIAHEAVHRWAAHLRFRNPRSRRVENLFGDGCECHWNDYLHQPVVYPVWPGYSSGRYPEGSLMGNKLWTDNGDGTFTVEAPDVWPAGLTALDLYVMGLIPADEVPDTFLLTDVEGTRTRLSTGDTVRATKVPVRIEDIVAAMGPRVPAADTAQKEFTLGIYLLHEDGRPPRPELLERARAISMEVPEYFARATGGRMRVVPVGSPAAAQRR